VQVKVLIQLVPGLLKELSAFLQNRTGILNGRAQDRVPVLVPVRVLPVPEQEPAVFLQNPKEILN
jgi:hypothetical protein